MGDRGRSGVKRAAGVRARTLVGMLAVLVLAVAVPAAIATDPRDTRDMLERYARDTWASFVAMTDAATGLPADRLHRDGTRSVQTSITNIGAYLWSTLVAEALGFVSHDDAVARLDQTLRTLETMDRHAPSGQFFNWYNHTTGQVLTVWPPSGATAFLSSQSVPARSSTRWISASTIGPRSTVSCFITCRAQGRRRAVTTPS